MRFGIASRAALTAMALAVAATAADAKCTRLAFSVNDYGKDGPTKDAMKLLDTYIAKWAADNGIKKYTTGKKTVSCELYLDLILFDEHTCKAEASVCWGEGGPATTTSAPSGAAPAASSTSNAPAKKPTSVKAAPKAAEPATAPAAASSTPSARPAAPKAKPGTQS